MTIARLATEQGVVTLRGEGAQWETGPRHLGGRNVWVVAHRPDRPETIFAGTYGDGLYRSLDDGASWDRVGADVALDYVRSIAFQSGDPRVVYVGAEPANLFGSDDGGNTWADLAIRRLPGAESWYLPYSPRGGAVRALALHPQEPALIYGGIEQGGVIKSVDGGATWTIHRDGVHPDIHSLAVHPQDPHHLYAATGGGLFRSRDAAETWEKLVDGYTRAIVVHPTTPHILFTAPAQRVGHEGRILASHDGGGTWTLASQGLQIPMEDMVESLLMDPHMPDYVYAVRSGGGLLCSMVQQVAWQPLAPGVRAVKSMHFAPNG